MRQTLSSIAMRTLELLAWTCGRFVHPSLSLSLYPPPLLIFLALLHTQYKIESSSYSLQVKSGTIFDNFLITDDEKYAEEFGNETWGETKDAEKKMKEQQDEEERKQAEEAAKAMEDEEGDEDEEEGDEEEEFDTEEVSDQKPRHNLPWIKPIV